MGKPTNTRTVGSGQASGSKPIGARNVGTGQAGHGNAAFEKSPFDKDTKKAPEGSAADKKVDASQFKKFQAAKGGKKK